MAGNGWERGERAWLTAVGAGLLGATLWPIRQNWRDRPDRVDGFPLSYYPMFSKRRKPHAKVTYGVGVSADGERRFLPLEVLGEGGHNQVRHQLHRAAVREGRAADWAHQAAARVTTHADLADVVRVEIVTGRFNLDRCLLSRDIRGVETVLAAVDLPVRHAAGRWSARPKPTDRGPGHDEPGHDGPLAVAG